jgi:hypothetical protein
MSRVAIYLADPFPIDRDVIRAAFDAVQTAGDRVVTLAQKSSGACALTTLVERLGDEFDRLLMVAGDDLYEFRSSFEGNPSTSAIAEGAGIH